MTLKEIDNRINQSRAIMQSVKDLMNQSEVLMKQANILASIAEEIVEEVGQALKEKNLENSETGPSAV